MFIDYVKKEYFGLIAELEQRVYPEELVLDMWTEKSNDGVKYKRLATQEDFDKF